MNTFTESINRHDTGSLKWDKYAGSDVLPLWVADMDFRSSECIMKSLHARVDHGIFGYTIPYPSVIEAVLDYLKNQHGVVAQQEWLCWLPGLVPALNVACRAFGESGSGVMVNTPVYPPFLSAPVNADRRRIAVPLTLREGTWDMDWDAMEDAVTPDTKLFIFCHPHNPVGRVWNRAEIERLVHFCEQHDLVLVSDEIHCDLILDDVQHVPTLALSQQAADRTIALYAPSKTFNLPGLACSFAVIPNDQLRAQFRRTARGLITEVNALGYAGCEAAYRHGEPWRQELLTVLRANRDFVFAFVRDRLPGVVMHPMAATYLAWLDVRNLNLDNPVAFFEAAGVGLSNGVDFGAPGFLRLNFGCPHDLLEKALTRMEAAIKNR